MWIFDANKYTIETQIDTLRASKELEGKDIQEAYAFIDKERKNYPDTPLDPLFREWEALVEKAGKKRDGEKQATLDRTRWATNKILTQTEVDALVRTQTSEETVPSKKDRYSIYNDRMMEGFQEQIDVVLQALIKEGDSDADKKQLLVLLKKAKQTGSRTNILALQGFMKSHWSESAVSKKGDPDGFFGPLTMESLAKIVKIKESKDEEDKPSDKPHLPTPDNKEQKPTTSEDGAVRLPEVTSLPREQLMAELTSARVSFLSEIKKIEKHFRNKQELDSDNNTLVVAHNRLATSINALSVRKDIAPSELAEIQASRILIARYFADNLDGISNNHFKDYTRASTQLIDVIGSFKHTEKGLLALPKPPTVDEIENKLANTPEWALIKKHLRDGKTMDQILTNPKFKSAWMDITEKVYGEWEAKLGRQVLWTLNREKIGEIVLTSNQKEALNLLGKIHDADGKFNLTSRNKDRVARFAEGILAVGAGVAGAALTATGIGSVGGVPLLALSWSVIAGGIITTGAWMIMDGRTYSGREWLIEWGINTATFAVGGMLFKLVWKEALTATKAAKVGIYSVEAGWVVVTGVVSDELRGYFYDADVSFTESIKQNLAWALLPLAFRMVKPGVFTKTQETRSENIQSDIARARTQENMGDTAGAKATLEGVAKDAENLGKEVKTTAEKSGVKTREWTKSTTEKADIKAKKWAEVWKMEANTSEAIQSAAPKAAEETMGLIRKLSDNKSAKIAWDIVTKEIQSGGFWKTAVAFPTNLMRLPAINARKIGELWVKKTEKGFGLTEEIAGKNRFLESLKVAAFASEKPFEGKTQTLASLLAMGTVAYITYQEILKANPSTPAEIVWQATWGYLKNMNITLPYEIGKIFFGKEVIVP